MEKVEATTSIWNSSNVQCAHVAGVEHLICCYIYMQVRSIYLKQFEN